MTELEKKLLLSKEDYEYLMGHFGYTRQSIRKPIITQINYYFDTDDRFMNRQDITCRVRLKNGKYKGMMKKHSHDSDHSTEIEMAVHDGIISNAFTDMGLKLQGKLITERCIIWQDGMCEVVLDKNEYLGYTDYELEIEYPPTFEHHAKRILNILIGCCIDNATSLATQHANNCFLHVPSKSKRFFERYSSNERRGLYESSSKNDS